MTEGVKWCMADTLFSLNFHIIPLGGYDIILGVNWMRKVSHMVFDFQTSSITFNWKGSKIAMTSQVNSGHTKFRTCQAMSSMMREDYYFLCHVVTV